MDGGAASIPVRTIDVLHAKITVQNIIGSLNNADSSGSLFVHCLAILHSPQYFTENKGTMRLDLPRVPLPADAATLRASAALGTMLAPLLDPDTPVPGVSAFADAPPRITELDVLALNSFRQFAGSYHDGLLLLVTNGAVLSPCPGIQARQTRGSRVIQCVLSAFGWFVRRR